MPFWMRNTFYFLLFCPSVFHSKVWRLAMVCVKFCNNIKRRYGRVKQQAIFNVFPPLLLV